VIWRQIFAVRGQGASLRGWFDAETSGRKGAGASAKPPILVWSQCLKGRIPGHSASSHSDCRRKSTPFHAANTFQSQYIVSANYGRAEKTMPIEFQNDAHQMKKRCASNRQGYQEAPSCSSWSFGNGYGKPVRFHEGYLRRCWQNSENPACAVQKGCDILLPFSRRECAAG